MPIEFQGRNPGVVYEERPTKQTPIQVLTFTYVMWLNFQKLREKARYWDIMILGSQIAVLSQARSGSSESKAMLGIVNDTEEKSQKDSLFPQHRVTSNKN